MRAVGHVAREQGLVEPGYRLLAVIVSKGADTQFEFRNPFPQLGPGPLNLGLDAPVFGQGATQFQDMDLINILILKQDQFGIEFLLQGSNDLIFRADAALVAQALLMELVDLLFCEGHLVF